MTKLYTKNTWVDEVLDGDALYNVLESDDTPIYSDVQIALATDVITAGTGVTAARMNNIENGIDALDDILNGDGMVDYTDGTPVSTDILLYMSDPASAKTVKKTTVAHLCGDRLAAIENLGTAAAGKKIISSGTALAAIDDDWGLSIILGNGQEVVPTGILGFIEMPFDGAIEAVRLLADVSGSIVVDIWKDTYANYPPTDADSITASAPPTLSSAEKSEDSTLTGWTKTFAKGDILAFNVDSATTVKQVTLSLRGRRTATE